MAKNATDEVYLNYHYYSAVKEKSDSSKDYKYEFLNAEEILKYANVEQSLRSKFGTVYKELFRHLHDSGLMTKFMEHACKYISYLLHKEISQTYEYDLDTYEKFYYYTEKYYKHENSRNKLCLNNMFYIDSNMFIKLKALYGLYDNYTDFLKKRNNWNYPSCDSLKALVRDYNNYMMNHQSTSIYLNGILEHFKDKLNDTIGKHKDKCTHYDFKLEPIKLFIEHKEEQPITKSPLSQPSDPTYKLGGISEKSQPSNPKFSLESLPEKSQPEVRNHRDTSKDNAETKLNELTVDPMVSEIKKIESEEETEQTVDTQKTVERERSTKTQPVLSASNNYETLRAHVHYEPFRHLELTHTVEPTEQSDLIEESAFIPRTVLKKEEGFFSNVQNTISGFIGEVDPVPVVGVSGGMGALFLLFRYTPVGAFFRGSRRRQRVPTRFDGVYPGFFPGFQGYEDGNFGYDQFNIAYGPE